MRNKDLIRRNHWKLWTNESAIPFVICACQNCCVKLQRNQHICWLIKRSMFSRYWSEFNKISIKANFLIAQRTWDENSIDFFFFLDIRSCIMSVVNKKKTQWEKNEKNAESLARSLSLCRFISFFAFPGFLNFFTLLLDRRRCQLLRDPLRYFISALTWDNWCVIQLTR